ncbi:MAG: HD domain-containing protein [Candidatus Diapherotrites archaeon]|nr:HD domain-containing protein [Candidatus Diapherotrites archaeon]
MAVMSVKSCLDLLEKHGVPQHIVAHSLKVHEVAMFLAERMDAKGVKVNKAVVSASALLHDIDKHYSFSNPEIHGEKSFEILVGEGMPKVAEIVKKHMLGTILKEGGEGLNSLEAKIVFYADKRVRHDSLVSLGERFAYLFNRYGVKGNAFRETIEKAYPAVLGLEKELLAMAGCDETLGGMGA